jgi:hypothetical protein
VDVHGIRCPVSNEIVEIGVQMSCRTVNFSETAGGSCSDRPFEVSAFSNSLVDSKSSKELSYGYGKRLKRTETAIFRQYFIFLVQNYLVIDGCADSPRLSPFLRKLDVPTRHQIFNPETHVQ